MTIGTATLNHASFESNDAGQNFGEIPHFFAFNFLPKLLPYLRPMLVVACRRGQVSRSHK